MFRIRNHVAVAKSETGRARLIASGTTAPAPLRGVDASGESTASVVAPRTAKDTAIGLKHVSRPEKVKLRLPGNIETSNVEVATVLSAISTDALHTDVLFEFISNNNNNNQGERKVNTLINRIYRDMYHSDAVSGSAVDLFSTLPFSEFTLTGLRDDKALAVYSESCERCNIVRLMPHMSRDHMVLGAVLACLSWDEEKKIYNGVSPQNLDQAFFTPVPVYGADPLINLQIDINTKTYLRYIDSDPRAEAYKKMIPDDILQSINLGDDGKSGISNGIPLHPDNTLFIPRLGLMSNFMGMSFFRRALPAWLIEKAFIRGTLDQSYKRQRAITHLTVGDVERPATVAEMEAILADFLAADSDPVGAAIATRSNVQINEVRRGDDYFKWMDVAEQLGSIKMRAMGLSESFISGESTFNNMEQILSLTMEQIRSHRAQMSHEVFHMKLFPRIAKEHNFTAKRYKNIEIANYIQRYQDLGMSGYIDDFGMLHSEIADTRRPSLADFNPNNYAMPQVVWLKRLMPEADREYLDMLTTLEEKGIPVGIRYIAAAGGINLKQLIDGAQEDIRLREQLAKIRDRIKEFAPKSAEGAEEMASTLLGLGSTSPRHILNREYGELDHPDLDSRGKRRVQTQRGKKERADKFNKKLAEVAAQQAIWENHKIKKTTELLEPRVNFYFRRAR